MKKAVRIKQISVDIADRRIGVDYYTYFIWYEGNPHGYAVQSSKENMLYYLAPALGITDIEGPETEVKPFADNV